MSTHQSVTGFVLAGGKSTRMSRDKALIEWHGQTLLQHMIELLSSAAERVEVVGRDTLPDRLPGYGPLSGIATALETSRTDTNLIVAVDLPLLTKEFLKYLRSRMEISDRQLIACKTGSHFPLCLGIRRSLLPEVERRLARKELSIHRLIENSHAEVITESELQTGGFGSSTFRNINTDEDYQALR